MPTTDSGRARPRRAVVYLSATTISAIGDFALWLAAGIWIKQLTGSSSLAGLTFFAYTLGGLTAPLAGMLADRVRRRPVIIATNLITILALCPLLLIHDKATAWIFFPVMVLYGVSGAVLSAAQGALVPVMFAKESLGTVNSVQQGLGQVIRVVAPGIGAGLFVVLGGRTVVAVDLVTFAVGAVMIWTLKVDEQRPTPGKGNFRSEASAGFKHLSSVRVLRQLMLASVLAVLVLGFFETIIFAVATQHLHRSAAFVGAFATAQGCGGVAGAVCAGLLVKKVAPGLVTALGLGLLGAASTALLLPGAVLSLTAMAVLGSTAPLITIGMITMLQLRTPGEIMGRAISAFQLGLNIPQVISIALGAALLPLVGLTRLLITITVVMLASALYLASRPEQRARETVGGSGPGELPEPADESRKALGPTSAENT